MSQRAILLLVLIVATATAACGNSRGKSSKGSNSPNAVVNATTNGVTNGQPNANVEPGVCGNGVVEAGELCDPGLETGEGACPTQCRAPACHTATLSGLPSECNADCSVEPVGCADGDGCCTLGCDATNDSDCTNICGDGVLSPNELCDGNCPTSCGSPSACSLVELAGDPTRCSAQCIESSVELCTGGDGCCPSSCNSNEDSDCGASCGNGALEPGESCDGNCPTSCDDSNACTRDTLAGSPDTCNVVCVFDDIRVCTPGDGCCPAGCTNAVDSDCSATCGDGSLDPGETCDGNCPSACSDNNTCTRDLLRGSAANCNVVCEYQPINVCQGGDGCCPNGCTNANDSDCQCVPDSCASLGVQCGPADNGCGGTLQCGACTGGTCNAGICDGGQVSSTIGKPCTTDGECADPAHADTYCLTPAEGYPGGYCTAACQLFCSDIISPCIGGLLVADGACHQSCFDSSECREGYSCEGVETLFMGLLNACVPN